MFQIRAAIRTVNPKELKFIEPDVKFNRQVFLKQVDRIKSFVTAIGESADFVGSCFMWAQPRRSLLSFLVLCTYVLLPILYCLFT